MKQVVAKGLWKRAVAMCLMCVLIFGAVDIPVFAKEIVDKGECGTDLKWTLDSDGELTISGTGTIQQDDFDQFEQKDAVKRIVIKEGINEIEGYAFQVFWNSLISMSIPSSVNKIDSNFCYGNYALTEINVASENINYTSENGILFNKDKTELLTYPCQKTGESYTIPNSVEYIGSDAFWNCNHLVAIEIPASVNTIGDMAFDCDELQEINVNSDSSSYASENGVLFNKDKTLIMVYPRGKKGESYTIPDGVQHIGSSAFRSCNHLVAIEIPASVNVIEDTAFVYDVLQEINVNSDNASYASENGILFNKDKTELIKYPCQKTGDSYTVPVGVKAIGSDAFMRCENLKSVKISDGVKTIGSDAFMGCENLKSVNIPEGVETIGDYAFYFCRSLKTVNLPDSIKKIGYYTFYGDASLTGVTIPSGVESIGYGAFLRCDRLNSITVQSDSVEIGKFALGYSELNEKKEPFIIYGHVGSTAETYANTNNFRFFEIGTHIHLYDEPVFTWDETSDGYTVIATFTCSDCGDTESLECTVVSEIRKIMRETLTASVTYQDKVYTDKKEEWTDLPINSNKCGENVTWSLDEDGTLTISGTGEMDDYEYGLPGVQNCPWEKERKAVKRVVVEEGVSSVGGLAFNWCDNLEMVSLASTVKDIGYESFYYCGNLKEINLPEQLETIGYGAFCECISLTDITVPSTVQEIGQAAFGSCKNLACIDVVAENQYYTSVNGVLFDKNKTHLISYPSRKSGDEYTIPSSVIIIEDHAFDNCNDLKSVIIPSSVETIAGQAFSGCSSLKSVTLPENITEISSYAFSGCSSLENVSLPESITGINAYAFSDCTSLKNIEIPAQVREIGYSAFEGCRNLTKVTIPVGVEVIGIRAFAGCTNLCSVEIYGDDTEIGGAAVGFTHIAYGPGDRDEKKAGFVIYGHTGSTAETYAKENDFIFAEIGSHVHAYNESFAWTESEDGYTVTATFVCADHDDTQTAICTVTDEITKEPTCTQDGQKTYTAKTVFQDETYEDAKALVIPATGQWTLDSDGTLTISGIGKMGDYGDRIVWEDEIPWDRGAIKKAVIKEGVTDIGAYGFYGCTELKDVSIPSTVTRIRGEAFVNCESLNSITIERDDVSIEYHALGYDYEIAGPGYGNGFFTKRENFVIYGHSGSTAEQYATENGFTFREIEAHVHTYAEPTFTWKETSDGYSATATFVCTKNDDTQTVTCDVTHTTKDATGEEEGQIVYTAKVTWNENTYTEKKTVLIPKKEADDSETDDEEESDDSAKPAENKETGWVKVGDTWHYNNANGVAQTGWINDGTGWYYTDESGAMQTGWVNDGGTWYYTSESGKMKTGWVNDGGTWYYTSGSGAMKTGWVNDGGTWYYTSESGAMQTGWVNDGDTWYYTSESGAMQTGWFCDGSTWYYLNENGAMQTGWLKDAGKWYFTNESGAMQTGWLKDSGKWYYLNKSGVMQTGWYNVQNRWYYSYASGQMAANTRIGSYRINANGVWVR